MVLPTNEWMKELFAIRSIFNDDHSSWRGFKKECEWELQVRISLRPNDNSYKSLSPLKYADRYTFFLYMKFKHRVISNSSDNKKIIVSKLIRMIMER